MEEKRQPALACAETSEGVSKDIAPLIFHELHHASSEHGWQPRKHIADQDVTEEETENFGADIGRKYMCGIWK